MKIDNDISKLEEQNFEDFISKKKFCGLATKENRKQFWKKVLEISTRTKTIERIKLRMYVKKHILEFFQLLFC